MRLDPQCVLCGTGPGPGRARGALDGHGVLRVECAAGHRSAIVLLARRYEVLLRWAGESLLDGAAAEAVVALAGALERAQEFYVRASSRAHGIAQPEIDSAWRGIAGQGGHAGQAGAFDILFLIDTGSVVTPDGRMTALRDRVLDQWRGLRRASELGPLEARPVPGSRPTGAHESVKASRRLARQHDAREFGEHVFARVEAVERALDRLPGAAAAEGEHELRTELESIPMGTRLTLFAPTPASPNAWPISAESFADYLVQLPRWRYAPSAEPRTLLPDR